MQKKVLCLIDTLGSGGAERQIVGLAILLKKKGYLVDLVSYHKDDFYANTAWEGGVNPTILKTKGSSLSKMIAVRRFIKDRGGYDWLITYKDGPNVIGCLLKILGMKFRLIVSERTSNRSRVLSKRDKLSYHLYRYADYVCPNSYSETDYIKESYPWLKNKTVAISNFTQTDFFTPKETEDHDVINVLTVSRVTRTKNIKNYIESIARVRQAGIEDVHFDWYGRVQAGHEGYAEECKEKIKELGLENVVTFHPATTNILQEYQKCDVFMLSSIYEGFPNVICEAMSCGKPIICSDVCDNPLIVKQGENGLLFDPNDIEDMSRKLIQILTMPKDKRKLWGENSRDMAVSLFSEESFVKKYIELIEQ